MAQLIEWDRKRRALELLAGDGSKQSVIANIWGDQNFPEHIRDMWKKFKNPKDNDFIELFERIAKSFLKCREDVDGTVMMRCSYDEFVKYMSPDRRDQLRRLEGALDHERFLVDLDASRSDVYKDWFRIGAVDQRYMYQDREAVDGWMAIVRGGKYKQYENCKRVLEEEFLAGALWTSLVSSGELGSVVILGAGAPQKDTAILNSTLDQGNYSPTNRLKFVILDSSFYMLSDTTAAIEDVLKRQRDARNIVELVPCCADFLKLRAWRDQIRPQKDEKKVAIFILGGTIGNIDEASLFEAVRQVTEPGDLFIVSGEFIPDGDINAYIEELGLIYAQDDKRDFALSAVRSLLDDHKFPREPDKRRSLVDVRIETDLSRLPNHIRSFIPGTLAAVFKLNVGIDGVNLVLVAAKRFREEEFRKAVKGFSCVETYSFDRRSKDHKYLVFRRDAD